MRHDPEIVHTPLDRKKSMPSESSRRSNGNPPRPPALWDHVHVPLPLPEPCYGRYPRGFLRWALRELAVPGREVLHVCSGGMSRGDALGGVRVDLRAAAAPDVLADGRRLPFADGAFSAVLLDPPYSVEYAETLYGVGYPRPSHLLAEAARVCRPSGAVCLLHYLVMVPPPDCDLERVDGITQGLGRRIRAWSVYRMRARGLYDRA